MYRQRGSYNKSSLTVNETLSAQSAASYAFLRSQPSTNSLSSAAAAAALRNAATTPASTPVENVQTKRMLKRQSSNSSQLGRSSSVRSASRHSIQRSGSTGSMSSRTFRDGSPHLKVPENPPACGIRRAASFSRRSSSVDTPRRTDSPSTRRRSTRSVSVDREVGRSSSKYSMPSAGGNRLSTVHEVDRAENRNSVLSRDSVVFLPNGPSPNPVNEHQSMSTVPPPTTDQSSVNEVAKAQIPASNATKVSRSDTRESATWNDEASREHDNHSARTAQVAKAQSQALDATEAGRSDTNESATWNDEASRKHDNHSAKTALAAAQLASLQKDGSTKPAGLAENLDMINNKPPGWAGAQTRDKDLGAAQQPRPTHRIPRKQLSNLSVINSREPPARTELPKEHAANSSVIGGESRLSPSNERAGYGDKIASAEEKPKAKTTQPGSPGRFAHFPEVSVTGSSDKVNKSPPRAFSPAKPALKHTTRRPLSPHTQPLQSPSELSDVTSLTSDDGMRVETKKRRVKVSFDDEAEIVGVAASPPTSPEELAPPGVTLGKPKSKSPWFNVNKRKRVQLDDIFDDEYNQVLKPRPALPTFDSIREVRDMEQQQATMEYPSDTDSLSSLASTPTASSDGKVVGGTPTDTRHGDIQGREGVPNKMPEVNVESAGSADNLTPMDENSTKVSSNALDVRADNGPSSNVTRKDENTMPSFRNIFTGLDFGMNVKLPTFPITEEPEQQEESEQQVAEINGKEENETVDFYLRTYKVPGDYPSPAEQYPERPLNGSHNQFFSPGSALGSNAQFRDDSSSVYNDAAESSSGPDGVSRVAANRNQLAARRKQPRAASQSQDRSGMRRTMRATADYPGMMASTLRGNNGTNMKFSTLSGTRKLSKTKRSKSTGRPFKSRLDYSDDENQSGEEGPVRNGTLRPVRGIPRRHNAHDSESTELEDSSENDEEEIPPPPVAKDPEASAMMAVVRSRGMTVEQLEEFLRKKPKGRKTDYFLRLFGLKRFRNYNNNSIKNDLEAKKPANEDAEQSRAEREQRAGSFQALGDVNAAGALPNDDEPEQKPEEDATVPSQNGYNGAALDVVIAPATGRKRRFPILRKLLGLRVS